MELGDELLAVAIENGSMVLEPIDCLLARTTNQSRRFGDMLSSDEVLESLRGLHAQADLIVWRALGYLPEDTSRIVGRWKKSVT